MTEVTIDNIKYVYQSSPNTAYVSGNTLTGSGLDLYIPNTINVASVNYTVNRIGDNSFLNCTAIYRITISGAAITTIGKSAFENSSISRIILPFSSTFTTIDNNAFKNCKSLEAIHNNAEGPEFNVAKLPNSVRTFGSGVFFGLS